MKFNRDDYATGGSEEHNDCSVRAYAVAACVDYSEAHRLFAEHGRKPRHRTPVSITAAVIETAFGYRVERQSFGYRVANGRGSWGLRAICYGPTIAEFIRINPTGHWIVLTSSHALAVTDGVVHDWKPTPRARVRHAFKLA